MLKVDRLSHSVADLFQLEAQFEVAQGERLALLGRSGSGKTSLLRLLAGLDLLAEGEGSVTLGGRDITRLAPELRNIGFVFQEGALFSATTVLQNAAFGLKVRGVSRVERERTSLELLKRVGLGDRSNAYPAELSGGERQRVALVRALVWKPQALFLDEPFSALDAQTKLQVQEALLQLLKDHVIPVVFVAHDVADIEKLATRKIEVKEELRTHRFS